MIITLGLAEVWRDVQADVFVNCTPIDVAYTLRPDATPSLSRPQPNRYEFRFTSFAENWANLEAIHDLLSQYGHPDLVSSSQFLQSL